MKRIYSIGLVLLFIAHAGYAKQLTLKEQLEQVNRYWKGKSDHAALLNLRMEPLTEAPLIQLHLSLVESSLRQKDVSHLTKQQQYNRNKCLDILHTYMLEGTFPKNLYHTERTPYFIDKYGTACAVGHIMINSGQRELAERISRENNYGYLADLKEQYPAVMDWAVLNGFTADELAWIQPYYGCAYICTAGQQRNVSCYGYNDGCVMPDPGADGHPAPYMITGYQWVNNQWNQLYWGLCDLLAGYYKAEVVDGAGATHNYYYTITQPPPTVEIAVTHVTCAGNNDGTAALSLTSGSGPWSFNWYPVTSTSSAVYGLSPGVYYATVIDGQGCQLTVYDTVFSPAALSGSVSVTDDNGSCDGSITISPSGGTLPYTYTWTPGGQTTAMISGLCSGSYSVLITDSNACTQSLSATVDLTTGINAVQQRDIVISPNPVTDHFEITLPGPAIVHVYNSTGQLVMEKAAQSTGKMRIDTGKLPAGFYTVQVNAGGKVMRGNVLKQ